MEVFSVANTEIQLGPDPATGAPVLRIQATPWGAHLAQVLADQAPVAGGGYYSVPHAALVDSRLMALVDVFIRGAVCPSRVAAVAFLQSGGA